MTSIEPTVPQEIARSGDETSKVVAELLSGDRLESVRRVLPDGVASRVNFALELHLPSGTFRADPTALWLITVCDGGSITLYVGHEDPVAQMSISDGTVYTTMAC